MMAILLFTFLCVFIVEENRAMEVTIQPNGLVYALEYDDVDFQCSSTPQWTEIHIIDRHENERDVTQIFALRNTSACSILYLNPNDKYAVSECGPNTVPFGFSIQNIDKSFNGVNVTCKVFINNTNPSAASVIVRIREPLQLVTIQPNGIQVIKKDTQIQFYCKVESYPVSTLNWYMGKQTILSSSISTYNFSESSWIYTADRVDNGKIIYCMATNGFESMNSSAVSLNITYRPEVQISPSYNPYRVVENTTMFQLTCNVTDANPGATAYNWFKDDIQVSSSSVYSIPMVKQADAGNYSCYAANYVGLSDRSQTTNVDVLYGPTLFSIVDRQQHEGTLLRLTCDGQSNPEITDINVRWTKNGNGTFSQTVKNLTIPNVNRQDSGLFVCIVTITLIPSAGDTMTVTAATSVTVDVLYRPIVRVLPSYQPFKVIENTTNLQLTCDVIESNPNVTSYRWYKGGDNSVISTDKVYTIPAVTKDHAGEYSCEAGNTVGSSPRSNGRIVDVLYGMTISPIINQQPYESDKLQLACDGQSNPAVADSDVRWTKNGNGTFSHTGKNLTIANVNRQDSGVFVCTVTITLTPTVGDYKTVTASTSVIVAVLSGFAFENESRNSIQVSSARSETNHFLVLLADRPIVQLFPSYQPFSVIENTTNLQLTCDVIESNPNVTSYRWFKGGDNSVISTDKVYTIPTVLKYHSGNYSCEASNTVGSSPKSIGRTLDVLYGPIPNLIPKQQPTEGHTWSVTCNGQSNPAITDNDITWTKQANTTFKRTGKQLTITNVNRQDRGTFICTTTVKLTPSIGDSVNVTHYITIIVDVLYRPAVFAVLIHESKYVRENTTNLQMMCNVSDANPSVDTYRWFKNYTEISRSAVYTIPKVERTNSGIYSCDVKNSVGFSDKSPFIELNVLYGVSLSQSTNKQVTNEILPWSITCYGDGNPPPSYTWKYIYNDTIIKVDNSQQKESRFIKQHANCMDTGTYEVKGKNGIGQDVRLMYEIEVLCKPRSTFRKQDVFITEKNGNISISAKFIGFPLPEVIWHRENKTDVESAEITETQLPFGKHSSLTKTINSNEDYGIYYAMAENPFGSFIIEYHIKPKTVPDSPAIVKVDCGISTAEITWMTPYNGGDNITSFAILLITESYHKTVPVSLKEFPEKHQMFTRTVSILKENTNYTFIIEAINSIGSDRSDKSLSCVTQISTSSKEPLSFGAGLGAGVGLFFVVDLAAIFIYMLFKRYRKTQNTNKSVYESNQVDASTRNVYNELDDINSGSSKQDFSDSRNQYEELDSVTKHQKLYENTQISAKVTGPRKTHKTKKNNTYDNVQV